MNRSIKWYAEKCMLTGMNRSIGRQRFCARLCWDCGNNLGHAVKQGYRP
jgi:hypothetical protein